MVAKRCGSGILMCKRCWVLGCVKAISRDSAVFAGRDREEGERASVLVSLFSLSSKLKRCVVLAACQRGVAR